MGKIYGENLWGKFIGKIYIENSVRGIVNFCVFLVNSNDSHQFFLTKAYLKGLSKKL